MKTWLRVLVFLLAASLLISPASAASDMPENHRFYDEITYLMDKGIVTGYSDGTVRPERVVTRAEAAVMIGRLKGLDGTQRQTPFNDVPRSHFASGFIAAAAEAGLLAGYPGGTYKPDAPIIRGDMAIILQRVFDLTLVMEPQFKDISANMKAYDAIKAVLLTNITIGYPDYTYRPHEHVTRGQFSAFLARGLEPRFKNEATITDSYLRDKTKVYVTRNFGVKIIHTYEKHVTTASQPAEFMWVMRYESGDQYGHFVEGESYAAYTIGYPPNTGHLTNLVYPVTLGKEFVYEQMDSDNAIMRKITGVNKTVFTPYKTFTNATEVTDDKGNQSYYVEGHGLVKTIDPYGSVMSELEEVR